jgi:hypothetical protein
MHVKEQIKLSVFLTKHHAMKTYWGIWSIAPRILDLGTSWRWVVSFTPLPLYPQGEIPRHPLDRRLSGPQRRSGRGGEEKNSQPVAQHRTGWAITALKQQIKLQLILIFKFLDMRREGKIFWTLLNWTELNRGELYWTECNWAELYWTEYKWAELYCTELIWTVLYWTDLNCTELSWTELNCTEL